jgi:hypothetical protein
LKPMTFELSDADHAHFLLGNLDIDAQLLAIRDVLGRNRAAEHALAAEIEAIADGALNAEGAASWHLDDLWVDNLHASVFQGAAHSMASAGMIAPLLETLLVRIFAAIGREDWPTAKTERRTRAGGEPPGFWNPQNYYPKPPEHDRKPKTNLILGIPQLAKDTGLENDLPTDYEKVVEALFTYRNFNFHNGFEWPEDFRDKFDEQSRRWPQDWFSRSTSGGRTWIVYMTEDFVQRCLRFVDEVLAAAGRLSRRQSEAHGRKQSSTEPPPA